MNPNTFSLSFLASVLCASCVPGRAEIIGYEPFDYTNASALAGADGGSFWDFRNAASARHSTKASAWSVAPGFSGGVMALSAGVLYTENYGVVRTYGGPDTAGETAGAVNNDSDAKKVYYRITMTRGTGTNWCGVSSFDFGTERLFFGVFPDGTNQFSIYDQNTGTLMDRSVLVCTTGVTYTLVAKVDYAADRVSLFVNPNLDAAEPATKTTIINPTSLVATAAYTGTNWSTGLRLGSDGLTSWDDLTVATTWDSLRTYPVTSLTDAGAGSLRLMTAVAASTGGRVTFPAAGKVFAVTAFDGLASNQRLIRCSRETPGTLEMSLPLTGLPLGALVEGMDFHPLTGELYALVLFAQGPDTYRFYRIDPATGNCTSDAGTLTWAPGTSNHRYGMDFLPGTNQVRIVDETGTNEVVTLTGFFSKTFDTPFPAARRFSAIAYAPGTRILYAVDDAAQALYRIDAGMAPVRIGALGRNPAFLNGFDISEEGEAWMSLYRPGGFLVGLNRVNLETGAATEIGLIGDGVSPVLALAVAPSTIRLTSEIATSSTRAVILDGGDSGVSIRALATFPGGPLSLPTSDRLFNFGAGTAVSAHRMTLADGYPSVPLLSAPESGGAILTAGMLAVDRCTFSGNGAGAGGGAIAAASGSLLKLNRCTFAGNSAAVGGALDLATGTASMQHCTFSGNRSTGTDSANHGGGALSFDFSTVTLTGCIAAGNTSASINGPDVWSTSGTLTAAGCVIGIGTGSGITETVANGNDVGTAGTPVPARLAPLADYGGTTFTMPPLPDSTAIDRTRTSNYSGDQRGLSIVTHADAGAAEYQGRSDLTLYWPTDWDGDGTPYGVEQATGTDPFTRNAGPLIISKDTSGRPMVSFPRDLTGAIRTRWLLKSSPDLQGPWTTVWSYNGVTSTEITTASYSAQPFPNFPAIPLIGTGRSLTYLPAATGKLFWRLEAEYIP